MGCVFFSADPYKNIEKMRDFFGGGGGILENHCQNLP